MSMMSLIFFAEVSPETTGIGIGAALAVVCSWERNRSLLWAILAGILGWFYVIYFAITRQSRELPKG